MDRAYDGSGNPVDTGGIAERLDRMEKTLEGYIAARKAGRPVINIADIDRICELDTYGPRKMELIELLRTSGVGIRNHRGEVH